MRILVLGDSFAHSGNDNGKGWVSILSKKYSIKNHALTCSPLYWSYKKLIENVTDSDVVILTVTSPGRLYTPQILPYLMPANIGVASLFANDPAYRDLHELYSAARDYFLHLTNFEFDNSIQYLLLKEFLVNSIVESN
jgi:hypothetical protein